MKVDSTDEDGTTSKNTPSLKVVTRARSERPRHGGESADQSIFAEMRSNLLLVAGETLTRRKKPLFFQPYSVDDKRPQQRTKTSPHQKPRQENSAKPTSINIMSMTPGVGFSPKDEKFPDDQKSRTGTTLYGACFERYTLTTT